MNQEIRPLTELEKMTWYKGFLEQEIEKYQAELDKVILYLQTLQQQEEVKKK